jgi:hypothetical protein
MAAVIPVGTQPQKISGTASKPYLITNDVSSASTIYIGQDSSVSVNSYGIKLSPGSSLTWTEISKEVWAVVASNSANVTVIYEATGTVSGQTTTLASVYPALLQTLVIPFDFTAGTGQTVNTFLNTQTIQNYSAIRIQISVNVTTGESSGVPNLDNGAYIEFSGIQSVNQLSNSTTAVSRTNVALWTFGNEALGTTGLMPAIQTYDFPVINTFLTSSWITWANGSTANSGIGTITARIYGLYNVVVQQERYQNYIGNPRAALEGKLIAGTATATSTGLATQAQNGPATLMLAPVTAGITALSVALQTWLAPPTRQTIARVALTTPGTINAGQIWNITLPNSPLVLEYNQTGAGTGAFSLLVTRN